MSFGQVVLPYESYYVTDMCHGIIIIGNSNSIVDFQVIRVVLK